MPFRRISIGASRMQVSGGAGDPFGGALGISDDEPSRGAAANSPDPECARRILLFAQCLGTKRAAGRGYLAARRRENTRATGPAGSRLAFASSSTSSEETVVFGIELAPEASVDLYGAQVEAQIGASMCKKKTTSASGIYPGTRFGDDGLWIF